jgi:hypothetical protein
VTNDANCSSSCDESIDMCTLADPDMTACNDGMSCNGADSCSAGSCTQHADDCAPDIGSGEQGDGAVGGCGSPPNLGPTCIQIRDCGPNHICFDGDDMTIGTGGTNASGCFTINIAPDLACRELLYAQDICSMTFPVVGGLFVAGCTAPVPLLSPMMLGGLLLALAVVALFGLRRGAGQRP